MSAFKYAIALTGGIACGKSTVVKMFIEHGFTVIDADSVSHRVLNEHSEAIRDMFGDSFVKDGVVDRSELGKVIFNNANERKRLESLLHPLIFKAIEQESIILDKKKSPYIVDIPLFFENGNYPIERSVLIYTSKDKQIERLMSRDDRDIKSAMQRIESQMSFEDKKDRATYIIDNDGDFKQLETQFNILIDIIENIDFEDSK